MTIRELLNHTGGTGDIFTPEYEAHRQETRTLADYVRLFGNRPAAFEPGSRMEYSNYGFILLGRIIELVTGEPYQPYVREHIYLPAGMLHTDARPETDQVEGRAIGYTHGPNGLAPNTNTMPWSGTSAGGGYSTVHDLFLFAEALQSGKLVSADLLREATRGSALRKDYGMGFMFCRTADMATAAADQVSTARCTYCLKADTCWLHWRTGTREWRRIWSISLPLSCRSTTATQTTTLDRLQELRCDPGIEVPPAAV